MHSFLRTPLRGSPPFPTAILLTGDSKWGSAGASWPPLSEALANVGIASLLFDYHGIGRSEGNPGDLTLTRGIENLKDVFTTLSDLPAIDLSRLAIIGTSFGASIAIASDTVWSRLRTMILKTPASKLDEAYEMEFGREVMEQWKAGVYQPPNGVSYAAYIDAQKYDLLKNAENIRLPVLIVHGDSDTIVPISRSKELAERIGGGADLVIVPGANHNFKQAGAQERFLEVTIEWLKKHLC